MFGLFSKKIEDPLMDFSKLGTDMHSHLLPGIDDGSANMETTIKFIKGLQQLGYKKLITTPHIFWDLYKNTPDIIKRKKDDVQKTLNEHHIEMEFDAAAEYFLDEHMSNLLEKKEKLLTLHDNMVLVEFSTMHFSLAMKDIIFDIQMAGYRPVLAHPERYVYLFNNRQVFHELKELGCLYQLNILSLEGGYGKMVKELSSYLLTNNLYSFIGTDLHHSGHLERLKKVTVSPLLQSFLDSGLLMNDQL